MVTGCAELPFCPCGPAIVSCSPELVLARLMVVTSFVAVVDELFPSFRLITSSGALEVPVEVPIEVPLEVAGEPVELFVLDAAPKLITISGVVDVPDDELPPSLRLMTSGDTGEFEFPYAALVPPRLITSSGIEEPEEEELEELVLDAVLALLTAVDAPRLMTISVTPGLYADIAVCACGFCFPKLLASAV